MDLSNVHIVSVQLKEISNIILSPLILIADTPQKPMLSEIDESIPYDITHLEESRVIHLEIYSIDGRQVYSNIFENTNTIRFRNLLDRGIYQVRITARDKVMTQRLIVE